MVHVEPIRCPKCGTKKDLHIDGNGTCIVCGYTLTVEDLEREVHETSRSLLRGCAFCLEQADKYGRNANEILSMFGSLILVDDKDGRRIAEFDVLYCPECGRKVK